MRIPSSNKLKALAAGSIPFLFAASGIFFYSQPHRYVVLGEPTIVCENGTTYAALPNDIRHVEALYEMVRNGKNSYTASQEDSKAKRLCAYGVVHDYFPFRNIPEKRNYTVYLGTGTTAIDTNSRAGLNLSKE